MSELSKEIEKDNYGLYSRSTKKVYNNEGKKNKVESERCMAKAGKYEKLYYDNYLCSYSARKNVLKSLFV